MKAAQISQSTYKVKYILAYSKAPHKITLLYHIYIINSILPYMPKSSCACCVCMMYVCMHMWFLSKQKKPKHYISYTSNCYSSHGQSLDHVMYQMKGYQMLLAYILVWSLLESFHRTSTSDQVRRMVPQCTHMFLIEHTPLQQ